MLWILIWLGWYAGGQVTILSILTLISRPFDYSSWNTILSDPILTIMLIYVFISFFFWGRGLFCGWLCPFGSLQELISLIAKKLNFPQIKIPQSINRYAINLKYFILISLFFVGLYSLDFLANASEVEPFKTAISMKFYREWYFVSYAIVLLFLGIFVERFFCRFVCPLGAIMVIGGKLRIFNFLKRRKECGKPCKLCAKECPIDAIEINGKINMNECFYCLDCQSLYYDNHKCPILVINNKNNISSNNILLNKPI